MHHHLVWLVFTLTGLVGLGGCDDGRRHRETQDDLVAGDPITVVDGQQFDEVFAVYDTLELEEPRGVLTVAPFVSLDSGGGFLVADGAEHQVRVYSPQGKLREVFGEGTERVDSIKSPGRALRLPEGDILVVNLTGPLTILPARHEEPSRFIPRFLRTARHAEILNDHEVLMVGSDSNPVAATLFRLNVANGYYSERYFAPPAHLDKWVTTFMSAVRTARRGNRIAAVHMLSDTLVIFDLSGREQKRVHIPIDPFRAPEGPLPEDVTSAAERYAWTAQFTLVMDLFWIDDNAILVQWAKALENGLDADVGILQMDTTGVRAWAIAPSPKLVAVRGEEFFFRDPRNNDPNRWWVAKRRVSPREPPS